MRNQFFQHFERSEDKIRSIWQSADFAFDANCLLNLYRYSESSSSEFLSVIRGRRPKLFLPEQAASEFFKNRLNEISNQGKSYDNSISTIDRLIEDLRGKMGHPFLPESIHDKLVSVLEEGKVSLKIERDNHLKRLSKDSILLALDEIFEDRLGEPLPDEILQEILSTGQTRMEAKVPPGYEDFPKIKEPKTDYEKRSNFGDYILWKQLIQHSSEVKRPLVFVTDDNKEDWWLRVHGRTIGPRPELIEEFKRESQQEILIYKSDQFLRYAFNELNENISQNTISELEKTAKYKIEDIHDSKFDPFIKNYRKFLKSSNFINNDIKLHEKIRDLNSIMSDLEEMRDNIETRLDKYIIESRNSNDMVEKQKLEEFIDQLASEYIVVDERIRIIRSDIDKYNDIQKKMKF
ncbi:PIN-like domain-containing protein [Martelella limonii]|uniref:PIN-like domain-containing protein n=1 Tax=Martelella limonii TaxID=1647649 RepID=UPI001580A731|nr:PIN domain-containing protein [Martelella limonii]